jgi:fructokinase
VSLGRRRVVVIGEALVDLVPAATEAGPGLVPRAGGAPANVAVGAARLGAPVAFAGSLSSDAFGRLLADHLAGEGADLSLAPLVDAPTPLAVVSLDDAGVATYGFYLSATAAEALTATTVTPLLGADGDERPAVVHVSCGAVTLVDAAGGRALTSLLHQAHGRVLTSFDPNVRPTFVDDLGAYAGAVEAVLPACDLVKVSDEDLGHLYPGTDVAEVARRWREAGAGAVVVTLGPDGALVEAAAGAASVPGVPVEVVDTVGAGDTFGAALLAWLHRHGVADRAALDDLDLEAWRDALDQGARAAAITCTRVGADPPHAADL